MDGEAKSYMFTGYDYQNTWNIDENGCFFKPSLVKERSIKENEPMMAKNKKLKQKVIVAFFVSADGGKVGKPIAIWRSKEPQCFRNTNVAAKRYQVSYFSNPKS